MNTQRDISIIIKRWEAYYVVYRGSKVGSTLIVAIL